MGKDDNALEAMIGKEPEHKIKGLDGKEYIFHGLALLEIEELMEKHGDIFSILWGPESDEKEKMKNLFTDVKFHLLVAWLGVRRSGITDEQLERGEWKISQRKLAAILPANIPFLMELSSKILEMTQWGVPPPELDKKSRNLGEEEKNSSREGQTPPLKTTK